MPKVSVIMPAYNAEVYIGEAIDSVLRQTFSDFELIILDDCSSDNTAGIVKTYEDSRIVYVKNEKNLGVAGTLNRGLENAGGMYIARMDADDVAMPDRFARQVAYLDQNPSVIACGSNVELIGDVPVGSTTDMPLDDCPIRLRMAISNPFVHPTMVIRREALQNVRYDCSFEGREDYRLWMVLSQRGKMENLPQYLLRYRIHRGQVTQKPDPIKAEKHYRLKKTYYRELNIGLTDEMQEALCCAAYYQKAEDMEMAEQLKLGLELIARHYGCENLPEEYIGLFCAAICSLPRKARWQLSAGLSIKRRLFLLR